MFGSFRTISLSLRKRLCNFLALPFSELLEMSELDELVKDSKVKFYSAPLRFINYLFSKQ
jgi:hypothetical protein